VLSVLHDYLFDSAILVITFWQITKCILQYSTKWLEYNGCFRVFAVVTAAGTTTSDIRASATSSVRPPGLAIDSSVTAAKEAFDFWSCSQDRLLVLIVLKNVIDDFREFLENSRTAELENF